MSNFKNSDIVALPEVQKLGLLSAAYTTGGKKGNTFSFEVEGSYSTKDNVCDFSSITIDGKEHVIDDLFRKCTKHAGNTTFYVTRESEVPVISLIFGDKKIVLQDSQLRVA